MAMATNTQENLAIAMAMAAAPPPGSPRTATALHDFAATSDNELTLTQGMRVIIIDDSDEHWWCCQDAASCHGGFVPASHLSVAGSLKTATALHDFAATVASHMTLTKGMRVWILDDSDEGGWWHCQDAASATQGYVPASHLSAAAVEAAAEPAQEPATQPSQLEVSLDEQLTMELEKTCPEWRGQLRAAVEARTLVSIVGSDQPFWHC